MDAAQTLALMALVQQLANEALARHQTDVNFTRAVEALNGSVTQLTASILRLETKIDAVIALQ